LNQIYYFILALQNYASVSYEYAVVCIGQ